MKRIPRCGYCLIHSVLRNVLKSQFCSRLLLLVLQLLFPICKMGLMAFPYLLRRSQNYCFKAQSILKRRLAVCWTGLKSGTKFWNGRQGNRGRTRRQMQLEHMSWKFLQGCITSHCRSRRWCHIAMCLSFILSSAILHLYLLSTCPYQFIE